METLIILIFAIGLASIIIFLLKSRVESFATDNEAIQNISSLYNSNKLTTTELVTNKITGINNTLTLVGALTTDGLACQNITSPTITQIQSDINTIKAKINRSYGYLIADNPNRTAIDRFGHNKNVIITQPPSIAPSTGNKNFSQVSNGILKYTGPSGSKFCILAHVGSLEASYYDVYININGTSVARADVDGQDNETTHAHIVVVTTLNQNDQITLFNGPKNTIHVESYYILAFQVD